MPALEVTVRTKSAIRVWAGLPPDRLVFLDDPLSDFRPGGTNELRVRMNEEFQGEHGFPISPQDWADLGPETVRDVRDEAKKRLEE